MCYFPLRGVPSLLTHLDMEEVHCAKSINVMQCSIIADILVLKDSLSREMDHLQIVCTRIFMTKPQNILERSNRILQSKLWS